MSAGRNPAGGRDLGVGAMVEVLARGADQALSPGVPVSQLDHALQTAALLAHLHPGDDELAVAGLVHDIGHLLPGGTDEAHAAQAAGAVRWALGERVAATVGLHVEAKRYLVATEDGYGGVLTTDSAVSLGRQGGAMTEEEAAAFLARPWAADAVALRRADDSGKVGGVVVGDLASWVPLLQEVSRRAGASEGLTARPASTPIDYCQAAPGRRVRGGHPAGVKTAGERVERRIVPGRRSERRRGPRHPRGPDRPACPASPGSVPRAGVPHASCGDP